MHQLLNKNNNNCGSQNLASKLLLTSLALLNWIRTYLGNVHMYTEDKCTG